MKFRFLLPFALPVLALAQNLDTSPIAQVDKELPKWFQLSGEYRNRAEGYTGGGFVQNKDEDYDLSRFRLNLSSTITSWFHVYAQMQDSRVWGDKAIAKASPYQDTFDLRLAYVDLGNTEKAPISFRIGRQELDFGNQRVLGSANWLNTPRSFDAARAIVHYKKLRADIFSSSVVNVVDGTFDHHKGGEDLHGIYGSIVDLIKGSTIEPYALWRLGGAQKTEAGAVAKRSIKDLGYRMVGKMRYNFDYEIEFIGQFGNIGTDTVKAAAYNLLIGHTWKDVYWTPRAFFDVAYATGDANNKDGHRNTYDQFYPSNHNLYGAADQFGFRNLEDFKTGLESHPTRKMTLASTINDLYLADAHDGIYAVTGNLIVRNAKGTYGRHIGTEWDGTLAYRFAKTLNGGAGYGHIYPGEFLKQATKGASYNYPYLFATYAF